MGKTFRERVVLISIRRKACCFKFIYIQETETSRAIPELDHSVHTAQARNPDSVQGLRLSEANEERLS